MMRRLRTTILALFTLFEVFALTPYPAYAMFFDDDVSVSGSVNEVLASFHVDPEAVTNFGEQYNVAGSKGYAPQVSILFTPEDPQPGKKITAHAFAQYFSTTGDSLYYTWYLKRKKCSENGQPYTQVNNTVELNQDSSCDYDGSGSVDINDYKIEAARVIAGGGYDAERAKEDAQSDDAIDDADGYVAYPGGDKGRSVIEDNEPYYYYIHDFNSGENYEIVDEIANDAIFQCGDGRVPRCISDASLMCPAKIFVSAESEASAEGGSGTTETNPETGETTATGTGPGSSASSAAATVTTDSFYDFQYCSSVGLPTCRAKVKQTGNNEKEETQDSEGEGTNTTTGWITAVENNGGTPLCPGKSIPVCVNETALQYSVDELMVDYKENYRPEGKFSKFRCTDLDIQESVVEGEDGSITVDSTRFACASELAGGGKVIAPEGIMECNPQEITAESFQRFHLFPYKDPGAPKESQVGGEDGTFDMGDEEFYRTDPFDPDTADNGIVDEASVIGLNRKEFSWLYAPGDEVGVIVEGASMNQTKHPDSSFMIMFATTNNACDYSGLVRNSVPTQTGAYTIQIKGYDVKIPAIATEGSFQEAMDKCLSTSADAFVKPASGGAAKKLNVELAYTPENPVNDPEPTVLESGEDASYVNIGDYVSVTASVRNASRTAQNLKYTWAIFKSVSGTADFDPENWELIAGRNRNDDAGRGPFTDVTPLVGNDLREIVFRMNLGEEIFTGDEDVTYIKVRAYVEEDFDLLSQNLHKYDVSRGQADVIIRIGRATNTIKLYAIQTADQATDGSDRSGVPMCNENPLQIVECPVVKNQIVKMVVDEKTGGGITDKYKNFRWYLNDQPLNRPQELAACGGTGSDIEESACNYLAVTGDTDTEYKVSVKALNVNTGRTVDLVQNFKVVDPFVAFCDSDRTTETASEEIVACSGLEKKSIGNYISDTAGEEPLYSENVFYAEPYTLPTIAGRIRPHWIKDQTVLNWFDADLFAGADIDGIPIDGTQKSAGTASSIRVDAYYQQEKTVRQLLRDVWGLTDLDLQEKIISQDARIEFEGLSEEETIANGSPSAFFAAIGANISGVVLYIFRAILTVGIIVFFVAMMHAIIPERVTIGRRKA